MRGSGLDFDGTPSSDASRCFDFTGYEVNLRHSVTTTSTTITATSTSRTTTSGTTTSTRTTSTVTPTTVTAYPSVAFNELVGSTCSDTQTSSGLTSATVDECKLQCFIDSTCLHAKQGEIVNPETPSSILRFREHLIMLGLINCLIQLNLEDRTTFKTCHEVVQ